MINELIILFCFTALMFFLVSALVPFKWIALVVPLNIVFLATLLYSFVQFIGAPIPFQAHIPFMAVQTFTEKNIGTIYSEFATDDLIHMVLLEDKVGFKYVTYKKTPELEAQLDAAMNASAKTHLRVKVIMTDTLYGMDAGSPFLEPDGTQDNMHEEKPKQQDGVETHEATGAGGQTN